MQFEAKKNDFLKCLNTVQSAISQKNTLPILSNLLIETDKNRARLTATDLDIGITSRVDVKSKATGSITIPAKKLYDIVKELPEEDVTIVLKKNNMISIDCGQAHIKIIGLPKEEFPQIPTFEDSESIELSQKLLKEMLIMVGFAVSRDETRYVLNGVLFVIKKGKIQLVATDGRRLALSTKSVGENTKLNKKVIIPTKTVQELIKMLEDDGGVKVTFSENQVFFDLGHTHVISRLIEGEFPDYDKVIPEERKEKVKIDRSKFLASVKRASLFTNQDSLSIKLDFSRNKMVVSKNAPFIGEVKEELDVKYGGKAVSIGFNPIYLIDALKVLEDETIELELEDSDRPGVIRKGNEYTYVVLPMQLI